MESLLHGARWAKVNANELLELVNEPTRTLQQSAEILRERYDVDVDVVTHGEQGSFAVSRDASIAEPPERTPNFVESGCGDRKSPIAAYCAPCTGTGADAGSV